MKSKTVFVIIILLILSPFIKSIYNYFFEDVNYKVTDYYIDAKIMQNGDLKVEELIVLKGRFNSYERDILYKNPNLENRIYNGEKIKDIKFSALITEEKINYETFNYYFPNFSFAKSANIGESGLVVETSLTGGKRYRIYQPSNNKRVAFLISYTIENVAVIHEDIAEVYWQFIGESLDDSIKNVQIRLSLPQKDNSPNFNAWAHGPLNGNINIIDNQIIKTEITNLEKNTPVDIRTTFALNQLVPNAKTKLSNNNSLGGILSFEDEKNIQANLDREKLNRKYLISHIILIIFGLLIIIYCFYLYFKEIKPYKSKFKSKYYRDFIEDYPVEVIDYLFNKKITPYAMSASILNMIYKKNIRMEPVMIGTEREYKFTLISRNDLTKTEDYLVNFLFYHVGNKDAFNTMQLELYAASSKTHRKFQNNYLVWKEKVIEEAKHQDFFRKDNDALLKTLLLVITGLLLIYFLPINLNYIFLKYSIIGLLILSLSITLNTSSRTQKGNENYAKWKAFKNFLTDFSKISEADVPNIALWEKYLVYATSLGIADIVAEQMNVKIEEEGFEIKLAGANVKEITYTSFYRNFNTSIYRTITSPRSRGNSTLVKSSSSGNNGFGGGSSSSGGGFSPGSGSGGGGGGGRGF